MLGGTQAREINSLHYWKGHRVLRDKVTLSYIRTDGCFVQTHPTVVQYLVGQTTHLVGCCPMSSRYFPHCLLYDLGAI